MHDPKLLSRVRQWLRERAGTAYCAQCIAAAHIKATAAMISVVLTEIEHRQPFYCSCPRAVHLQVAREAADDRWREALSLMRAGGVLDREAHSPHSDGLKSIQLRVTDRRSAREHLPVAVDRAVERVSRHTLSAGNVLGETCDRGPVEEINVVQPVRCDPFLALAHEKNEVEPRALRRHRVILEHELREPQVLRRGTLHDQNLDERVDAEDPRGPQLLDERGAVIAAPWDAQNPSQTSNYSTSMTVYDSLGNSHTLDNIPFVLVGGEAIFGFALAMVWGIVIGAYSSIYVAAPLQLILGVKRDSGMASAPARAKIVVSARPRLRRTTRGFASFSIAVSRLVAASTTFTSCSSLSM